MKAIKLRSIAGVSAILLCAVAMVAFYTERDGLAVALIWTGVVAVAFRTVVALFQVLRGKDTDASSACPNQNDRWTTGSFKGDTIVWTLLMICILVGALFLPEIMEFFR